MKQFIFKQYAPGPGDSNPDTPPPRGNVVDTPPQGPGGLPDPGELNPTEEQDNGEG